MHGAFGDRPDLDEALRRAVAEARRRAGDPQAAGPGQALGEVARAALALPALPDDEDWQLNAIAYADERLLRAYYDACVALAGGALRIVEAA